MTLDYQNLNKNLSSFQEKYKNNESFPYIVLDNFLNLEIAEKALKNFPSLEDAGWIHYKHYNENKGGLNKLDLIPKDIGSIISELNSDKFVKFLSELTGIENLISDPTLEGGGIHQSKKGGFLNIHADFTAHPHKSSLKRRVNLLIYLNKEWKDEYEGKLELWTKDMKRCFKEISPIFNRCVIFNTDEKSFHGHPKALNCPDNVTRKSIALYYFTEENGKANKIATNYQGTPSDSKFKKTMIWVDKKILVIYNNVKSYLGLSDDFASKVLNFISKIKRK